MCQIYFSLMTNLASSASLAAERNQFISDWEVLKNFTLNPNQNTFHKDGRLLSF